MPEKFKEIIENVGPYAGFSAFGGIALYLHQVRKGKPFSILLLILNAILAGWIGTTIFLLGLTNSFDPGIQVGIISVTGFLSYPILNFIEEKGFDLFIKKILGGK